MVIESTPPPPGDFEIPSRLSVGIALTTSPSIARGRLEQLCLELQAATGIEVQARPVATYEELLEALAAGRVDIVWLPPVLALRAAIAGRAVPIALPVRNGLSSYWAALFSCADSQIRGLADLEGLSAAWVDPQSASGYRIIRSYLHQQGVDLRDAFLRERFFAAHDSVAAAVLAGDADVGATFVYFDQSSPSEQEVIAAGWGDAQVHIVARTGPIPADVVAARAGLSAVVVRLVQSALVDVQNAELRQAAGALLNADGFIVPSEEHLSPIGELLQDELEGGGISTSIVPPVRPSSPDES